MNNLIAIVGMCGAGKSVASSFFEEKGYKLIHVGDITFEKLREENLDINPENERYMREKLRKNLGMGAYAILLKEKIKELLKTNNVVLDGVYSFSEVKILKEEFENLKIICVIAEKEIRYKRLEKRKVRPLTKKEANDRDLFEIKNIEKASPIALADYYILNNKDIKEYKNDLNNIYNILEKRN